jgi:hypothetical protein
MSGLSGGSANDSVQTAATGSNFTILNTRVCRRVHIFNDTGADLEVQQDGGGVAVPVYAGTYFTFNGIENSNQLAVRRKDQANTQVTVKYRWEYR